MPMTRFDSSRSLRIPVSAAALAIVLALTACSRQQPTFAMPQAEVTAITVKPESLAIDSELPGRTSAYQSSDVRPQVGGILRKRLFSEGADVKAGQVLYEIDPATYQAAYDTASGDLAKAEASVISARPKAERYRSLVALDAVSKQSGDEALAALREAQASVIAAKASLQSAKINLNYTRIAAPISGRIGTSTSTPGALVTADQSAALATINQLDPILVDVTQSSAQLLQLRRQLDAGALKAVAGKAQVRIVLEDGSTYAHAGTLEFVGASVDKTTGNVQLRAIVPNPGKLLLPGMYVKAVLSMATNEQALLIPQQSVSRNAKGEAVALVVGEDAKVQQRVLELGQAVGDRWSVRSGLKAGEKVVVEGGQKVKAGDSVKVADSRAAQQTAIPPNAAAPSGKPPAN